MSMIIFILSVFLIAYTYVLYPFLLLLVSRFVRRRAGHDLGGDYPLVSVVIAAHDEEKVIEEKIRNTLSLDYPEDKIEVLIGSDGSEDRTDEICRRYSDRIRFQRIEPRQGKANVLNTLVPMAKGEIILFSDANSMIRKGSLKKLVRHFNNPSVGGVCGRLVLESRTKSVEAIEESYWKYETGIKKLESRIYSTIGANGGIYAIRKEYFKEIPRDTIIDDFWISLVVLESGKRILFEEDAVATEYISDNTLDEFWRKVRIGSGNIQTFFRKPYIVNQNPLFVFSAYYTHKVVRWLIPFLLISLYFSLFSLSSGPLFLFLFHMANLGLLFSLLCLIIDVRNRFINMVGYLAVFNFALLLGYIRYLAGRHTVTWRRAAR